MLRKINFIVSALFVITTLSSITSNAERETPAASCEPRGRQDHMFAFDVRLDNQNAAILDYKYGNSKNHVSMPPWAVQQGRRVEFNSVSGELLVGEFLYVKWEDRESKKKIYEDTVDLRCLLPEDVSNHIVTFMVHGSELTVYLVLPKDAGSPTEQIGPRMYNDRIVKQIYPPRL